MNEFTVLVLVRMSWQYQRLWLEAVGGRALLQSMEYMEVTQFQS
jgi:hypothetical protein